MKYSEGFKKEDPMHGLPEKVATRILEKTEALAGALSERSDYLGTMLEKMDEKNAISIAVYFQRYLVCRLDQRKIKHIAQ